MQCVCWFYSQGIFNGGFDFGSVGKFYSLHFVKPTQQALAMLFFVWKFAG
jgi:uncharacterized membrane protein